MGSHVDKPSDKLFNFDENPVPPKSTLDSPLMTMKKMKSN